MGQVNSRRESRRVREEFRASGASSEVNSRPPKRPNSWASAGRSADRETVTRRRLGGGRGTVVEPSPVGFSTPLGPSRIPWMLPGESWPDCGSLRRLMMSCLGSRLVSISCPWSALPSPILIWRLHLAPCCSLRQSSSCRPSASWPRGCFSSDLSPCHSPTRTRSSRAGQ